MTEKTLNKPLKSIEEWRKEVFPNNNNRSNSDTKTPTEMAIMLANKAVKNLSNKA